MEKQMFNYTQKKGGEKMKKILLLTALVVLFAVPVMAASGIKSSKHNLGSTGKDAYTVYRATTETQICVFCHTPHNATQNVPLWNRNNPAAGGFSLYTSSPTLNIATADRGALTPQSISLFCLSCHDGTAGAISSRIVNEPNGAILKGAAEFGLSGVTGRTNLGTNLSNDHPVNFSIDLVISGGTRGSDSTVRARADMAGGNGGLNFFNGGTGKTGPNGSYIECGTCHNPHGTVVGGVMVKKFLRKTNDSSSLCLTCHIK